LDSESDAVEEKLMDKIRKKTPKHEAKTFWNITNNSNKAAA